MNVSVPSFFTLNSTPLLFFLLLLLLLSPGAPYSLKPLEPVPIAGGKAPRIFSLEDLKAHDGSDETRPIYIAIRGVVFDVTEGKDFYGKNTAYNILAGKDASRAVARMSLDPDDLTDDLTDLTDEELEALDERFQKVYLAKYPVVGYTVKCVGENLNLFVGSKEEL